MNYMPKVLETLGVEVGEKFKIKEFDNNPYHFDCEYILVDSNNNDMEFQNITQILRGVIEIEKLPWKPKEGECYYAVLHNGSIDFFRWGLKWHHYYCYNSGNCFRTKKEITPEIKQRILSEMKGKYENDI